MHSCCVCPPKSVIGVQTEIRFVENNSDQSIKIIRPIKRKGKIKQNRDINKIMEVKDIAS